MADLGLIGLAVMGQNLVLNFNDRGYSVAVYNRTAPVTAEFLRSNRERSGLSGAESMADFIRLLDRPRKIILMVKAGGPVDAVLAELLPLLSPGDVVMDGGQEGTLHHARRQQESLAPDGNHAQGDSGENRGRRALL